MRVRLVRRPGQHGTKTYMEQYGDKLVCVRYRYDQATKRRYKTIEIVVEEAPWEPKGQVQEDRPPHIPQRSTVETSGGEPSRPVQPSEPVGFATLKSGVPVGIKVAFEEVDLAQRLQDAGAIWVERLAVWQVAYAQAVALGLTDRIVGTIAELVTAKVLRDRHR